MESNSGNSSASLHPLRWFPEFWRLGRRRLRPQARLLGLSLLLGVIAGLGAVAFYAACQGIFHVALDLGAGYHPSPPGGEPPLFGEGVGALRPWMLLLAPTIGGILSGIIVFTLAPEAEGHGTDAAIKAYHHHQGRIRPLVPLVKIVASALTIGTGGSGGREGPIAQIGAGFGSWLGALLRLSPSERRILMAAGVGAGVGAIFRAPLAGALFASEVLYSSPDFESEVIIPAGLSSVTAYCTFGLTFGWKPLFVLSPESLAQLDFKDPLQLIPYLLLALFMVILAMLYTRSFYAISQLFHRLPVRRHLRPGIGAFLSGLAALGLFHLLGGKEQVLSVMAFGYGIIQDAMMLPAGGQPDLAFALVLLAVALGKILTTSLTIGSGGSGGIFGPSMVIGGCGGGALGILLRSYWPQYVPPTGTFVIVGMAGFFAAAAKTPISTLVIVSEMTGNYHLLLPALWVCTITFLLSDEQSIYGSQVSSRSRSPAHQGDYVREVLAGLQVRQFLTPLREVPSLRPGDRLAVVIDSLGRSRYQALPVVDSEGRLQGMVSWDEIHLADQEPGMGSWILAADLMRSSVAPLVPEDRLDRAVELFVENDLRALPVVDGTPERRLVGLVRRSEIDSAYLRHVHGAGSAR